jgi:hypothetical protein
MWNGDVARSVRMFELPVIALPANMLPSLGLKPFDDLVATHGVYAYTPSAACQADGLMGL